TTATTSPPTPPMPPPTPPQLLPPPHSPLPAAMSRGRPTTPPERQPPAAPEPSALRAPDGIPIHALGQAVAGSAAAAPPCGTLAMSSSVPDLLESFLTTPDRDPVEHHHR